MSWLVLLSIASTSRKSCSSSLLSSSRSRSGFELFCSVSTLKLGEATWTDDPLVLTLVTASLRRSCELSCPAPCSGRSPSFGFLFLRTLVSFAHRAVERGPYFSPCTALSRDPALSLRFRAAKLVADRFDTASPTALRWCVDGAVYAHGACA